MRPLFALVALALSLLLAAPAATAAERAIIVLDGSGSMWAQIDGLSRIEIARDTLSEVLGDLPDDLELGFMSYGHREKGDCADIELLVEPGLGTSAAIAVAAHSINPKGKTPISDAVRRAAEALQFSEAKATVILITDGIETCDADPCQIGADLEAQGVDFTAHVVGFGLSDAEGQEVACLAENTGGQYIQAKDAPALTQALTTAVAQVETPSPVAAPVAQPEPAAPEFNLMPELALAEGDDPLPDDTGNAWEIFRANADGSPGEYVSTDYGNGFRTNLEPGDYVVNAMLGEATTTQLVTIVEGEVARPYFVLNAGTVVARPRAAADQPVSTDAAVEITLPGGRTTTYYGESVVVLPAGEQNFRVTIGAGEVRETFALAAGETIQKDFVVGIGRAAVNAFYVEGMKVEDGSLFVEIVGAKKSIDGSRQSFSYAYGPDSNHDLPPGDYVAVATMDQTVVEVPFTVTSGELVEINAVLGAGVLAVSAPGFDFVEIAGKPDIAGNRKSFGYNYGGAHQGTLPAGEYTVIAHTPGDTLTREAQATVVAGERTEVTIALE